MNKYVTFAIHFLANSNLAGLWVTKILKLRNNTFENGVWNKKLSFSPKTLSCAEIYFIISFLQKLLLFYINKQKRHSHTSEHKSLMIKYPSFLQLFTFSLFNAVLGEEMVHIWHTGDSGKFSVSAAHKLDGWARIIPPEIDMRFGNLTWQPVANPQSFPAQRLRFIHTHRYVRMYSARALNGECLP